MGIRGNDINEFFLSFSNVAMGRHLASTTSRRLKNAHMQAPFFHTFHYSIVSYFIIHQVQK